ncbi:hypothetical protein C3B61_09130 [Cryobacterium zongtaii]|uniref:Uncharacterized protein n=1 Tax=Cryobacterium zongtaii TaxID=1259217 RepID=A0A2S3ZH43_9MICO|nr:hypothetical protein [Cryobacterium zongtaii]POH66698.1 hypothetical protein C3B61_09130 [Cryobacterium zongtaii]
MGKWSGDTWLGWALVLFCLSLASTFIAGVAGFNFDPDDYPSSYYAARVPGLVGVMVVSLVIPALAAAASVLSARAGPHEARRTATATVILVLALSSVWLCLVLGIDSVQQAIEFSEHAPM